MTLKEKLTQVIIDLTKESIRYPNMETIHVCYMLAKLIEKEYDEDKKTKE